MLSFVYHVDANVIKERVFTEQRYKALYADFFEVFDEDMKVKYHFSDNPNNRQLSMVFVAIYLQQPRDGN